MVYKKYFNQNNKKKHNNQKIGAPVFQSEIRIKVPKRSEGEVFALVTLMSGTEYIKVLTDEGKEIAARIPGKMRKKIWIRNNDVVIVKKWDTGEPKGDLVWRFMPLQVQKLKREGYLKNLPI